MLVYITVARNKTAILLQAHVRSKVNIVYLRRKSYTSGSSSLTFTALNRFVVSKTVMGTFQHIAFRVESGVIFILLRMPPWWTKRTLSCGDIRSLG